jgi:hypothetical protein
MIVYCEVHSCGIHFYAALVCGRKITRLEYCLTDSIRRRLAASDVGVVVKDSIYWKMRKSNRFITEKKLRFEAKRQYKTIYPGATVLVYGYQHYTDPQELLDGPPKLMEEVNRLAKEAKANDYCDGDPAVEKRINQQFREIWNESGMA